MARASFVGCAARYLWRAKLSCSGVITRITGFKTILLFHVERF